MADQPQIIVEVPLPADRSMGSRKQENLLSAYPSSPIHSGLITDDERKSTFQSAALDGDVVDAFDSAGSSIAGGPGHGFNNFHRDYHGAPVLGEVVTGGGGLPTTPYIPPLTSPGPGSISATDQPEFTGTLPDPETNI